MSPTAPRADRAVPPLAGLRTAVVDADAAVRRRIAEALAAAGAAVVSFADEFDALAAWRDADGHGAGGYDLIVCGDRPAGRTLVLALRAAGFRGVAVGLAGDPVGPVAERWRDMGVDLVAEGGLSAEALVDRVARACRGRTPDPAAGFA